MKVIQQPTMPPLGAVVWARARGALRLVRVVKHHRSKWEGAFTIPSTGRSRRARFDARWWWEREAFKPDAFTSGTGRRVLHQEPPSLDEARQLLPAR